MENPTYYPQHDESGTRLEGQALLDFLEAEDERMDLQRERTVELAWFVAKAGNLTPVYGTLDSPTGFKAFDPDGRPVQVTGCWGLAEEFPEQIQNMPLSMLMGRVKLSVLPD